jgi:nicotinamidase-related amidase
MAGVRFCTGIFLSGEVETEIFSALMAEFKKVLIQDCTTNLTVAGLHVCSYKSEIPN